VRSTYKVLENVLALLIISFALLGARAFALPEFMMRFSQDPFSRPELRDQCSTCHISPKGGGPRKPFGSAFEKNKHIVTPEFRRAWPDHFLPSVTSNPVPVPSGGGEIKATFLGNERETILEIDGQKYRLIAKEAKLDKIEPEEAAKLVAAPPPAAYEEPKLPLREQPTFDHYVIDLPTTLPYRPGVLSLRFTHRFTEPVLGCNKCAGIGELYGLDSVSYSSLGVEYGINNRLAAVVYRSPLSDTIEIGGVLQVLRQKGSVPFSADIRISEEGKYNFTEQFTTNLVFPVSRSISNVAELFMVPMVNIHANAFGHLASRTDAAGVRRTNQAEIGLGASIRFRPRSAFVMEWVPRLAGYHAIGSRNAYSFGILRTTNGHVFELVLTNTVASTTSRFVGLGTEEFSLGFNIYRRLR